MKVLGRELRWSDASPAQTRSLAQVEITDLVMAMDRRIGEIMGLADTCIASLYRGAQFLTDRVASFRMQQVMGKTVTAETPPLLAQPNPTETYHATMSKIVSSLLFKGNAYLWIRTRDRGTGTVRSVYVLNPAEVSVTGDVDDLYPEYWWRGKRMEPLRELIHIPFNHWPGYWIGVSPVEAYQRGLDQIKAEMELARNIMVNNGSPSGLLEVHRPELTRAEADAILDIWNAADGVKRNGPRVTSDMATFKPLAFHPMDLQFIEQRVFSVKEVARLLGLDPYFLGEESGGSLTYSTTESLFRLTLNTTIGPSYLEKIEQAFSLLLPQGRTARFNVDEVLRADMEARFRAGEIGVGSGLITPNEWREAEGLSPVSGGDEIREKVAAPSPNGAFTNV